MPAFSQRVEQISISGIREVFEAAGDDAINLGIGQPDFPTPDHAKAAAVEAIETGVADGYTSNKGIVALREAIAAKHERDNGFSVDPSDVIATAGGSEALHLAMEAHVEDGQEVIFPDPGFVSYDALTKLAGGEPHPVPLREDGQTVDEKGRRRTRQVSPALLMPTFATIAVVGGIAGIAALVGASMLLHRRLADPRIRQSSSFADIAVLALIWLQLVVGVATVFWTMQHLGGEEMVLFMGWANAIITFDPSAPSVLAPVAWIYKLHIVLGLTLFLITPFTRLVHIWSAPIWFLFRPGYQIVRSLAPIGRRAKPAPTRTAAGPAAGYGGTTALRQQSESGQST